MKVYSVNYCDFVICSQNELVLLRIDLDKEFVCEAIGKATTFCKYEVLPELVGKYYTRDSSECSIHTLSSDTPAEIQNEASDGTETEKWCYCEQEDFGNMIFFCEGDSCKRQRFHMNCLKLGKASKGKMVLS